jgi:hypothetical protein
LKEKNLFKSFFNLRLPYKPAPHKVILKEAPASPNEEKTLNILWPTQQVNFKKSKKLEFKFKNSKKSTMLIFFSYLNF